MKPETTVIIPTFERPAELRGVLGALAGTETPRGAFEVIVVDDGSRADLRSVVRQFDADLDLTLLRQQHRGPAAGRNLGAREARGSLLAFTDDDCLPEPDWIEAMQAAHKQDPEALIGGRTFNALTENRWATASQVIVEMAKQFFTDAERGPLFFPSNNMAVPAEAYWEVGGFSEGFPFAAEDRDFCDRWCQADRYLRYEPRAIIGHRHNLSALKFWKQHYRYGFGAWRYHQERRRRSSGQLRDDVPFYLEIASLLCHAMPEASRWECVKMVPQLLVWQVANAAGFVGGLLSEIGDGRDGGAAP